MVSNQPFSGVPAQTCSPPDKRRIHGIALPFPRRPAHAVLCAARTRGDRLFEANLLILRCFLDTLGFSLHEPLLLRGVERPDDLLHPHLIAQIERFGLEAAEQATRLHHE